MNDTNINTVNLLRRNPRRVYAVLSTCHTALAVLLIAVFLAHFGAARFHALVRRDDVLKSMTPPSALRVTGSRAPMACTMEAGWGGKEGYRCVTRPGCSCCAARRC